MKEKLIQEIQNLVREEGRRIRLSVCCPVQVAESKGKTARLFVKSISVGQTDGDVMLAGDDGTVENYQTMSAWLVEDDDMMALAEAVHAAVHKDYMSIINKLREEMKRELWKIILFHKDTDDRCSQSLDLGAVFFRQSGFYEVEFGGAAYKIDGVRLVAGICGVEISVQIEGQWTGIGDVETMADCLHAVRNALVLTDGE